MAKQAWKAWHEVVKLRSDVRSGELTLSMFAADLYEVAMDIGPDVYRKPSEFFALTYPTYKLRDLAKDVALRLAGKSNKAVRQLELTYGGGKTHTLITMYHLFRDPNALPDLPSVNEFKQHIGIDLPKARIVTLTFDKLDVEKGTEAVSPSGEKRWLKEPWSVMAYQIAGEEGLRLINGEGKMGERPSSPADNVMRELLSLPSRDGFSTLILIDEVLMYAREKVAIKPESRGIIMDFFQYLTSAATKVPRCAIVASLLATDPRKSDTLGKELTQEMYAIFRREKEEGVQPVSKDDVAEILRRRFFTPESLTDREAFRPHVLAALKGISDLDENTQKDGKIAEEEYQTSYPFNPHLTDVLYTKWTNLDGFQRTRGVLRTFALALRDAEKWDQSPLVGANVLLASPGDSSLSEAARELTGVATTEEYEGKHQDWARILEGELEKAIAIQASFPGLSHREAEQAVMATFLHSQPIGQKALTHDLFVLVGATRPDKIQLKNAFKGWAEVSWFLDESMIAAEGKDLPKAWRLGSKPNLNQMHHDACTRINADRIDLKFLDLAPKVKKLKDGTSGPGITTHMLPDRPSDIQDDGKFHYAVLGPRAVSESGKPSAEAKRFVDETTGPSRPRKYRNSVILAVPSRDGLEAAKEAIKVHLGWNAVATQLASQEVDSIRAETLESNKRTSERRMNEAIAQAYNIVVTVSRDNDVQAFRLALGSDPLFIQIKNDERSRICDSPINADALTPRGPYDGLWHEGEISRRAKDIVDAFVQFPQYPKMLDRKAILDTLAQGAKEGRFVLALTASIRTYWFEAPETDIIDSDDLEVVLSFSAKLTSLKPMNLIPGKIPGLWSGDRLTVKDLVDFFSGGKKMKISTGGYDEEIDVPIVPREVIDKAINEAVKSQSLWILSGSASIMGEDVPAGLLTDDAILMLPPVPIPYFEIMPINLPDAWSSGTTTAWNISILLSKKKGMNLPWGTIRRCIDDAVRSHGIEIIQNWPCDESAAKKATFKVLNEKPVGPSIKNTMLHATAKVDAPGLQTLDELLPEIIKLAAGADIEFSISIQLDGEKVGAEKLSELRQKLREVNEGLELK